MSTFDGLFTNTATKTAPKTSGGSFDGLFTSAPKAAPAPVKTQSWNGQEIPANIPTKNLVSYDSSTGNKTFNLGNAGSGVYTEDRDGKLVKQGHSTYGGVPAKSGFERADIIPVSLGGVNANKNNIAYETLLPKDQQKPGKLTASDANLQKVNADIKSGKVQPKAGLTSQIGFQETHNFPNTNIPDNTKVSSNFLSGLTSMFSGSNIKNTLKQIAGIDSPNSYVQADTVKKAASIPLELPSIVADIMTKTVTAPITITKDKLPLTVDGLIKAYKNSPNLTDVITQVVSGQSLPDKNQKVSPTLAFLGGFTGEIARQALGVFLLSNLGDSIATKKGTLEVSPKQVQEALVNPNLEMPEPVKAELTKYAKTGFKLERNIPAGGARQAIGEVLGGSPQKGSVITPGEAPPFAHELNAPKVPETPAFAHEQPTQPFAHELAVAPKTAPETAIAPKTSVISYIDANGQKVFTKLSPEELSLAKDEVANIPSAKGGSQIHLDAVTAQQQKTGTEISREEFIQGHPQAQEVFDNISEKTPSKIAQSIEQKAVESNLTKGFEGVAGYDKITIKDQAERATKLMADPEEAMKVIKGESPLPEGLRGTALITAAEEHIARTGDVRMAYELANSPLVSETSAAAQELRLAAEREPDSLTRKLQEVKLAKEKAAEKKVGNLKKAKSQTVKEIKTEVSKAAPKVKDWQGFLEQLKCN